jgi:hypothetical protein
MATKVPAGCYPRGPENNGWAGLIGCTGASSPGAHGMATKSLYDPDDFLNPGGYTGYTNYASMPGFAGYTGYTGYPVWNLPNEQGEEKTLHEKGPAGPEHIQEKPEYTQEELDSIRAEILKSPQDERIF